MRLLIIALSLSAVACGPGHSPPTTNAPKDEIASIDRAVSPTEPLFKQFWKIEQDRLDAGRLKNVEAVKATTADSYVQVDWQGNVLNKSNAMSRIGSSAIRIRSNNLDEMQLRQLGNLMLVVGRATRTGSFQGKDISESVRYSRLYRNDGSRWQVIFFQQTAIPVGTANG